MSIKESIPIKYTYSDLVQILDNMYDEAMISSQDNIDWGRLEKQCTESIIEKLYQFQDNSQRIGFLAEFIRRIFNDGKGYNLALAQREGSGAFNNIEYAYLMNCLAVLNSLIDDVSEACLNYPGIDFAQILKENSPTYFSLGYGPRFIYTISSDRQNRSREARYIIDELEILILHHEFDDILSENRKEWIKRFDLDGPPVDPLPETKKEISHPGKIALLAILYAISELPKDKPEKFSFDDFAKDRFGYKNFSKDKSTYKDRPELLSAITKCENALKRKLRKD